MAYSNVTAYLSNSTTVNLTSQYNGTGDYPDVAYWVTNLLKNSVVSDGAGNFFPVNSILSIKVQ
jgi:hypothetical protein